MSGSSQPHCVGHVDTRLDYAFRGSQLGRFTFLEVDAAGPASLDRDVQASGEAVGCRASATTEA